ncbi:MAG: hypothetical protein ACKVWV_20130 [Planctomycetota bacterium]
MSSRSSFVASLALLSIGCASAPDAILGVRITQPEAVPDPVARAFERLRALAGKWEGKSTKGWTEEVSFETIAGGSCVVESSFDAHPNEKMLTIFYMDGPQLMLTHYCVAKNQPRLRATEFGDDATSITFTFQDATNLPSRDRGHMDKCHIRFLGPDRLSVRWTWFQDGQEKWMEEIEHRRVAPAPQPAS